MSDTKKRAFQKYRDQFFALYKCWLLISNKSWGPKLYGYQHNVDINIMLISTLCWYQHYVDINIMLISTIKRWLYKCYPIIIRSALCSSNLHKTSAEVKFISSLICEFTFFKGNLGYGGQAQRFYKFLNLNLKSFLSLSYSSI